MEKKVCSQCGLEKELEEFHRSKYSADGHKTSCKACASLRDKARYETIAPETRRAYARGRYAKKYQWILDYKVAQGCKYCGTKHPAVLEFHHPDPTQKEFEIGSSEAAGYGRDRLLVEMKKCIVVCANCHRKLHWQEKHDGC